MLKIAMIMGGAMALVPAVAFAANAAGYCCPFCSFLH